MVGTRKVITFFEILPHNVHQHLRHPIRVVYDQLPMLHARKAGDTAVGSERLEVAKHILGYKGLVLPVPVVHIGAAYTLEARGVDGLVGIAHGTAIA